MANNVGSLYSLKQKKGKGGVDAYVAEFNRLVSESSEKWSDDHLTDVFLDGLRRELRRDVRLYRPESLCEAIGLAQGLGSENPPFVREEIIPNLPRYEAMFMEKTPVKVLITSSTHNFISPYVLEDWSLVIKEDDPLFVKSLAGIGDDWTTTAGRINGAQVNLQGFQFAADFYVLPDLNGSDILLGTPWLCLVDEYRVGKSEDSFTVNGINYQLTAEKYPPGTITQDCCMSVTGIRKSMLPSE